jgi:hypothetical protein
MHWESNPDFQLQDEMSSARHLVAEAGFEPTCEGYEPTEGPGSSTPRHPHRDLNPDFLIENQTA